MVIDTLVFRKDFIEKSPKVVKAVGRQLLRGARHDQARAAEGRTRSWAASVKQTGRAVRRLGRVHHLDRPRREQGVLRQGVGAVHRFRGAGAEVEPRDREGAVGEGDDRPALPDKAATASGASAAAPARVRSDARTPEAGLQRRARLALGAAFFVLFFAAWAAVTFGGVIDAMFLKTPIVHARTGYDLFPEFGFLRDIGITVFRVVGGFVLAAIVAVPLGIAMGAFKPIEAFFEPFVSFCRVSAGLGIHSAADPVGRRGRDAEARGDLHRLGVPDHPDGRGDRRRHAARSRRGGVHPRRGLRAASSSG